jgi:hypothetical protein
MTVHSHEGSRTAHVAVLAKEGHIKEGYIGKGSPKRCRVEDEVPSPPTKIRWVLPTRQLPPSRQETSEEDTSQEMSILSPRQGNLRAPQAVTMSAEEEPAAEPNPLTLAKRV